MFRLASLFGDANPDRHIYLGTLRLFAGTQVRLIMNLLRSQSGLTIIAVQVVGIRRKENRILCSGATERSSSTMGAMTALLHGNGALKLISINKLI